MKLEPLRRSKAAMAAPILRRITRLIMISRMRTLLRQRVNHRVVRERCRLHAESTTLLPGPLDIAGAPGRPADVADTCTKEMNALDLCELARWSAEAEAKVT
jgi:hypothetical protein